jgi:hypothetical protein
VSVTQSIEAYASQRGGHHSGTLRGDQLAAIEAEYSSPGISIETGCGASTILLSRLSTQHTTFCFDDRNNDNSSVAFVTQCPLFDSSCAAFVFGPTQKTLPAFNFQTQLDLALIDGPHAFPFAELEYYYIYPRLKPGALLIVDDVHIPTLFNFYRFLREEPMFRFVRKSGNLAIFRRTDQPTFDPLADGWREQEFNRRRFPAMGRDEKFARLFPKWLTRLAPSGLRAALRSYLLRSQN